MPDFQPAGPEHPHARGEPTQSAREIARQAAADAVRGPSTAQPGTRFDATTRTADRGEEALPSDERAFVRPEDRDTARARDLPPDEYADVDEYGQPLDEWDTAGEPEPREPVPPVRAFTVEDYERLQAEGIFLPVSPEEVPEDFQDVYADLAQSVVDIHRASAARMEDMEEAQLRMSDFARRLNTPEGQERLLLGVALSNGQVFTQVAEMVQRMQEDPDYAENVKRRLEADMRYEAATRKERAIAQAQRVRKGQMVEERTVRLARRLGVDEGLAKEMVASRVLQNEASTGRRDISIEEVDTIVTGLGRRFGQRGQRRAKPPEAERRERQAPRRPEGTGRERAPAPAPEPPRYQAPSDPLDALRSAVRRSADRVRSKGL